MSARSVRLSATNVDEWIAFQRWPTTFYLRAILQKRYNLRATFNKMMHKTTDSQHVKLKREDAWVHHWNYYTIANGSTNLCEIFMLEKYVFSD